MRILIIAQNYARSNANTFRYRFLAERLVNEGYIVDVVGDRKLKDYIPPANITYYNIFQYFSFCNFFSILYYTIIDIFRLFPVWKKCFNLYFLYTILICGLTRFSFLRLTKLFNYDAVILSVVPWSYYPLTKMISRKAKLILDISDPLYKNAVIDTNFYGDKLFKKFETNSIKHASYVIVMSEPLVNLYLRELNVSSNNISFISPSTVTENYRINEDVFCKLTKPVNLIYAGTIYKKFRDITELLSAINGRKDFYIEIVTQKSKKTGDNVIYTKWLTQNLLFEKYYKVDLLVFVDNFFGFQVPSKIFELIALNKPILFIYDERNTYLRDLLIDQKGMFFTVNTKIDIINSLNHIMSLDSIVVNYSFDLEQYSNDKMCDKFVSIIKNVVNV